MNRLASETSPYLRQHRGNPVDWYPWGPEALARARAEDRPILLSIGYSACHWCHVMEHECFENEAIARLMNERFVCIKVDREERPDLDLIYQGVAQALTRGGGWPLTVFLTPELKPYFGGTYFPPEDRHGRPGFPRVCEAISRAYREDPRSVAENAEKLTAFIQAMDEPPPEDREAGASGPALLHAARLIAERVDGISGGLAGAPKFPHPMLMSFLLRTAQGAGGGNSGDGKMSSALAQAAHVTLEGMARGGVFDQLRGGFHRYSVDATWSVPHFEKMLYDNGLCLRVYAEALCAEGPALTAERRRLYLRTLRLTLDYLCAELRSPEGAFYCTQDADSEGEEGKFFVWRPADLDRLVASGALGAQASRALALRFGITEGGNFEHGATVLHLARSEEEVARELRLSPAETEALLEEGRKTLLAERAKRIAPATDRKLLAAWNGLAISGLAWAAQAFELNGLKDEAARARAAARGALECVRTRFARGGDAREGRLYSTLQEGQPKHSAHLDDYAFLAAGALDLARFTGDEECLRHAAGWIDLVLEDFGAPGEAGYFFTGSDHERLIHRPRSLMDQATPSGTAVTLGVLLALADLLPEAPRAAGYREEARRQLAALGGLAVRAPLGAGELLCAAWLAELGPVTVQGEGASAFCRHPHVFSHAGPGAPGWVVCVRGTCLPPETDPARLEAALARATRLG